MSERERLGGAVSRGDRPAQAEQPVRGNRCVHDVEEREGKVLQHELDPRCHGPFGVHLRHEVGQRGTGAVEVDRSHRQHPGEPRARHESVDRMTRPLEGLLARFVVALQCRRGDEVQVVHRERREACEPARPERDRHGGLDHHIELLGEPHFDVHLDRGVEGLAEHDLEAVVRVGPERAGEGDIGPAPWMRVLVFARPQRAEQCARQLDLDGQPLDHDLGSGVGDRRVHACRGISVRVQQPESDVGHLPEHQWIRGASVGDVQLGFDADGLGSGARTHGAEVQRVLQVLDQGRDVGGAREAADVVDPRRRPSSDDRGHAPGDGTGRDAEEVEQARRHGPGTGCGSSVVVGSEESFQITGTSSLT